MATQVASLFGVLSLRDEGFQRGLQDARGGLRDMGQRIQDTGRSVRNFGAGLTLATAPLTAFAMQGLRVAASFDTTFTEISARTGIVGDDLEMLRERAIQWGSDTVFSAQQSADAFLQLLTTGMSVEDSITTMESVLVGAAAAGLDLGTTADRLTNILAGMGLEVDVSADLIDRLGRASGVVAGGMGPLMEAMEAGAGTARTYGMEMDELIPILAIWSDAGVRGSEAGTQLRAMLRGMTADTASTRRAWEMLGTSMHDADGAMRPIDDVLDDIRRGLATMTEQEQAQVLTDLAGSYGIVGLNALLASDGIGAMNARMAGAASASDIAEAQMGTFEKTVESLLGSVDALMITALTPLMEDVLQPLVGDLIEVVNNVRGWMRENPELTNTIVMLGGALLIAGQALVALGMAVMFVGAAMGVILSPIGLLIAGVAALAAAFVTDFMGIRTFFEGNVIPFFGGLWDVLREEGLSGAANYIKDTIIDPLSEQISEYVGSGQLWDDLQSLGEMFLRALAVGITVATAIGDWIFDNLITPLAAAVMEYVDSGQLWDDLQSLGEMFLRALAVGLVMTITIGSWLWEELIQPMAAAVVEYVGSGQLWDDLQSLGASILRGIAEGLPDVVAWVNENIIQPIINAVKDFNPMDFVSTPVDTWSGNVDMAGQIAGHIAADPIGAIGTIFGGGSQAGTPWTGSGAVGEIAGFHHHQEAVVPAGGMMVRPSPDGLMLEGAGGGGDIHIGQLVINASTEEGGRAAARGFRDELQMLWDERG